MICIMISAVHKIDYGVAPYSFWILDVSGSSGCRQLQVLHFTVKYSTTAYMYYF